MPSANVTRKIYTKILMPILFFFWINRRGLLQTEITIFFFPIINSRGGHAYGKK